MLADFRRCCCGLATNVAAECRDGCKFLEISGVFYKLMALAGEFGIDLAPDHGWHDRPSGSQTHESILAFRQAWLHGNNHGGRMAIVLTTFPGRDSADCDASLGRDQFDCPRRKQRIGQFHWPTGQSELPTYSRSNDAFFSLAWLRCPSSGCVFLTTPTVKGATARP
jgi:hypothetical protein